MLTSLAYPSASLEGRMFLKLCDKDPSSPWKSLGGSGAKLVSR